MRLSSMRENGASGYGETCFIETPPCGPRVALLDFVALGTTSRARCERPPNGERFMPRTRKAFAGPGHDETLQWWFSSVGQASDPSAIESGKSDA